MCGGWLGKTLAKIDPGPAIGKALAKVDPGPAIGSALAGLDDLVGNIVPGGWGTIAKIALTAANVPAPIANGLVTVAEGVHRGQSPEQALLNGIKSGAISAATAGVIKGIESVGVDNVIADWEFAATNGSFADAASYFSDSYVAPAINSNLSSLDGINFSNWSLEDIGKVTGITGGSSSTSGVSPSAESDPIAGPLVRLLEAEVRKNEAAGMARDSATQKAIVDLSLKSDVYRRELGNLIFTGDQRLMDALGQSQESLIDVITGVGSGISTEISSTRQAILDQVARNEAAGMSRDAALDAAIKGVSTNLGLTEQNLLGAIGQTKTDLSNQITFVRDDLTGQITGVRDNLTGQITNVGKQVAGVGQQVTDLTGQFGEYRTEQERRQEEEQREKRGKEAVNLLSQMATTTVKTPEVAKIDYMYDIGGDSLFATAKQESLMPSPFEDTPEEAEGAMPKYQYYVPGGGYSFAEGGEVSFPDSPADLESIVSADAMAPEESGILVRDAIFAYGKNPNKYEEIYSQYAQDPEGGEQSDVLERMSKVHSGVDMATLSLLHSAKQSGDPEGFLESLIPYVDSEVRVEVLDDEPTATLSVRPEDLVNALPTADEEFYDGGFIDNYTIDDLYEILRKA
jgi:hypothetical protein